MYFNYLLISNIIPRAFEIIIFSISMCSHSSNFAILDKACLDECDESHKRIFPPCLPFSNWNHLSSNILKSQRSTKFFLCRINLFGKFNAQCFLLKTSHHLVHDNKQLNFFSNEQRCFITSYKDVMRRVALCRYKFYFKPCRNSNLYLFVVQIKKIYVLQPKT